MQIRITGLEVKEETYPIAGTKIQVTAHQQQGPFYSCAIYATLPVAVPCPFVIGQEMPWAEFVDQMTPRREYGAIALNPPILPDPIAPPPPAPVTITAYTAAEQEALHNANSGDFTECRAEDPEGFGCTRAFGHAGKHIAAGFDTIYATWGEDEPAEKINEEIHF